MGAYQCVSKIPTSLTPTKHFDHQKALNDEFKLMNAPPYRYAHFQKEEIEQQVKEMLKNGLIRMSPNSFFSSVLLVKKMDETRCFWIDY